jgi:hypothetical protein
LYLYFRVDCGEFKRHVQSTRFADREDERLGLDGPEAGRAHFQVAFADRKPTDMENADR